MSAELDAWEKFYDTLARVAVNVAERRESAAPQRHEDHVRVTTALQRCVSAMATASHEFGLAEPRLAENEALAARAANARRAVHQSQRRLRDLLKDWRSYIGE